MREIKFRAWNGKEILRVDTIDYGDKDVRNCGDIFRVYAGGYHYRQDEKRIGWGRLKDIVLMQFTGLKDKNGKEIYEGDVCKIVDSYKENVLVKWREDYASFYFWDIECEWWCLDFYGRDSQEVEVIGNIYQNPELLK